MGDFERNIQTAELDADAARLRLRGLTYREIAAEMGCVVSAAHDRVRRAIESAPAEAGNAVRQIELERLDFMYAKALEVLENQHLTVSNGRLIKHPDTELPLLDDAPVLQAIATMLRIQERRARLLGLDAPTRQTMTVITEDVAEQALQELLREEALAEALGTGQAGDHSADHRGPETQG